MKIAVVRAFACYRDVHGDIYVPDDWARYLELFTPEHDITLVCPVNPLGDSDNLRIITVAGVVAIPQYDGLLKFAMGLAKVIVALNGAFRSMDLVESAGGSSPLGIVANIVAYFRRIPRLFSIDADYLMDLDLTLRILPTNLLQRFQVAIKRFIYAVSYSWCAKTSEIPVAFGAGVHFRYKEIPQLRTVEPVWVKKKEYLGSGNEGHGTRGRVMEIVVANSLSWKKNPYLAVETAHLLFTLGFNYHMTFIGTGEYYDVINEYVLNNGLSAHVNIEAPVPYRDGIFHKMLRRFDVGLVCNRSNESPRVFYDLLSQGVIPVVPPTLPFRAFQQKFPELVASHYTAESFASVIMFLGDRALRHRLQGKLMSWGMAQGLYYERLKTEYLAALDVAGHFAPAKGFLVSKKEGRDDCRDPRP